MVHKIAVQGDGLAHMHLADGARHRVQLAAAGQLEYTIPRFRVVVDQVFHRALQPLQLLRQRLPLLCSARFWSLFIISAPAAFVNKRPTAKGGRGRQNAYLWYFT